MIKKLHHWWFGKTVSIYPTLRMTNKTGRQCWRKYKKQHKVGTKYNIRVHSPLPGEGIKNNDKLIKDRRGKGGKKIWKKDSKQIYQSNAISFEKENMKSQGSIFELVKARGALWKITVFIHSKPGFIAREQADITARSLDSAYRQLSERFGSRHQRFIWRIKMLIRSVPKWIWNQIKELFR